MAGRGSQGVTGPAGAYDPQGKRLNLLEQASENLEAYENRHAARHGSIRPPRRDASGGARPRASRSSRGSPPISSRAPHRKRGAIGEGTAAAAMQALVMTIAATLLLAVLGVAIAVLIGRSVSRPVVAMTSAMRELADGNTPRLPVPGPRALRRDRRDGRRRGGFSPERHRTRKRLTSESEKEQLRRPRPRATACESRR